jgi:signal transduction histidine kinase/CheY-like chemotaxis protein
MTNSFTKDGINLEQILALMPGNVFWKDAQGRFLGCNNNVAKALNLKSCNDIVGKTNHELFDANLAKLADVADREVIIKKKEFTLEEIGLNAAGNRTIYLTKKIPLFDEQGSVNGILGISFDIIERKKMEATLKKAKKQAEEASELKSQFIADIQHDLRTSCAGISAMTELLAQQETDQEKKEILQHVAQASTRLLNILDTILAFNQAQSGSLPVIERKFRVKKIFDDIFIMQKYHASKQKTQLILNYDNDIPSVIIGDEQRITRVLLNIINNAIKFSPQGSVTAAVKTHKIIDKQHILLQVKIKDTGIGIPSDKLQYIYDRFIRVFPANKNKFKGMGLGLSVAKRFMDDIGGKIEVQSELKKGSEFICTFPVKLPLVTKEAIKKTKTKSKKSQKLKILLVEDDALVQIATSAILQKNFSENLAVASSGREAIQLARKNKYDVILMDIGLPDITGYKVTQTIRNLKTSKNKNTKIIALTAHNMPQEKKNSLAFGMNAFLVKPLNIEKTRKILQKILREKSGN